MKHRIQHTLSLLVTILLTGSILSSCEEKKETVISGTGINEATWVEINDAAIDGEILPFEFMADGAWFATSSEEDWCKILGYSGPAGLSALRIKVEPNGGDMGRSAEIIVKVKGAPQVCRFTVRQGDGLIERGSGKYREINRWMFDFMSENYLWNESMPSLLLDYSLDYQSFLTQTLQGIAAQGDVNHDDGLWENGKRKAFFTYVQSKAPVSRATGVEYNDGGILKIQATQLGNGSDGPVGYVVIAVTPGTEAHRAGIKRGDFINRVNNIAVTAENYQTLARNVYNGNCIVEVNDVTWADGVPTLHSRGNVQYSSSSYIDPAIYKTSILTAENGKKVGYLLYMGFNMTFDDSLIEAFGKFKAEGISDLVLDLRYNNGGHVLSSTVMGTLIAGDHHKGSVYVKTTYNSRRTAQGEVGVYRIGEPSNPESSEGYDKIPASLTNSLGLSDLYVITSGTTASAAELVINGLRGLGLNVHLVGLNTMGKNVGMEGVARNYGGYSFIFYPVTFYCENAKGFKKYSGGFTPDLLIDDSTIYPGDFTTASDPLSSAALSWAATGVKPQPKTVTSRGNNRHFTLLPLDSDDRPVSRHQGGSIQMRQPL